MQLLTDYRSTERCLRGKYLVWASVNTQHLLSPRDISQHFYWKSDDLQELDNDFGWESYDLNDLNYLNCLVGVSWVGSLLF